MSICNNKAFNRFLFFSLLFLFVSFIVNSVIVLAAEVPEKKPVLRKNTIEIQVQQREILNHLERIEKKAINKRVVE